MVGDKSDTTACKRHGQAKQDTTSNNPRLTVDGREIAPVAVEAKDGKLDLATLLGGTAAGKTAWLYIPIQVKTGGKPMLGFGADWWLQAWVDGKSVCDTLDLKQASAQT